MFKMATLLCTVLLLALACSGDNNNTVSTKPDLTENVQALSEQAQHEATAYAEQMGTPTSIAIPVELGEPFELEPGDRAVLTGAGLSIQFNEVAFSSRCPGDVECIWQGEAAINLGVSDEGDKSSFELKIDGLTGDLTEPTRHTIIIGSYSFTLLNLDPYPIVYPPDDYDPGPDRARILILAD